MDLWAQMYLLDQGERLGKTITQYRNKYFAPAQKRAYCLFLAVNPRSRRGDLQQNKRYMREYESKRLFTATTTNGKYYRARLEPDKLETVQRARTEYVLELEETDVVASNAATLSNKLLQLSNGAVYDENGDGRKYTKKVKCARTRYRGRTKGNRFSLLSIPT